MYSGVGGFCTIIDSVWGGQSVEVMVKWCTYSGVGGFCTILDSVLGGGQSVVELMVKWCIVVW